MTRCSSGSLEGREILGLVDGRVEKESIGGRPSIASQGASEDGRRRFQFQEAHGVGENYRSIPVPESSVLNTAVGRDVVSSVETTFSISDRLKNSPTVPECSVLNSDVGRDSSVETTLSILLNDLQSGHVFSFVWMAESPHRQSIDDGRLCGWLRCC